MFGFSYMRVLTIPGSVTVQVRQCPFAGTAGIITSPLKPQLLKSTRTGASHQPAAYPGSCLLSTGCRTWLTHMSDQQWSLGTQNWAQVKDGWRNIIFTFII